jgi:hypothetical protein
MKGIYVGGSRTSGCSGLAFGLRLGQPLNRRPLDTMS